MRFITSASDDVDRLMALSTDFRRVWFGSLDGTVEVEIELDGEFRAASGPLRPSHRVLVAVGNEEGIEIVTYDDRTGERLGDPITIDAEQLVSIGGGEDTSLTAFSVVTDGPGFISTLLVVDRDTGEIITEIETDTPFRSMRIDGARRELVGAAGAHGGGLFTIDLESGEIASSVEFSVGDVTSIGIRSDGLVVAISNDEYELLDRRAGSIAPPRPLGTMSEAFLRPDGRIEGRVGADRIDVINIDGNGLVEQSYDTHPGARVTVRDGLAAVTVLNTRQTEIINLATGERTNIDLLLPNGARTEAAGIFPYDGGIWANSIEGYTRWVGGERLTSEPDGTRVASLVALVPGQLRVVMSVPAAVAAVAHPPVDGGMYVVDNDGTMRTYDAEGNVTDEIDTGVENARAIVLDPANNQLAIGGSGVAIVDISTGKTTPLPQAAIVNSLGFGQSGTVLATVAVDGDVRLWDVERGEFAGLAWNGTQHSRAHHR